MKYSDIEGTNLATIKSYEDYKDGQLERNKKVVTVSKESSWETESNIELLSTWLKGNLADVKFGLCHGTRNGLEQGWFSKRLNCEVIGTEISPLCEEREDTIIWDFHDVKEEWKGAVDFIYSNSFDHSYKPIECLEAWLSCMRNKKSVILLAYGTGHSLAQWEKFKKGGGSSSDLFHATEEGYKEVVKRAGGEIKENIQSVNPTVKYFVIQAKK